MKCAKLIASLVTAGFFSLVISGCDKTPDQGEVQAKAKYYLARADSYQQQGQYRAALIEARNALQAAPDERSATLKLASLYQELGQIKTAKKTLEGLGDAATPEEALAMANLYLTQRKFRSAIDYLEKTGKRFELDKNPEAILILATCNMELGKLDIAEDLFSKLDKNDATVALRHFKLLEKLGRTNEAEAELALLLQTHPDNVDVLSEAANLAEQKGNLGEAENLYTQAAMNLPPADIITPKKSEVLQHLVSVLTKLGRSHEALIYESSLSDSNPASALLQDKLTQGMDLFKEGKLDEAKNILTDVYKESRNQTAGILLGLIHYAKNDLDAAEEFLGANTDPEVTPEAALATLAATQLRLDQPEKILQLFDKEDRKYIKSPDLKLLVGMALQQTGQIDEGENLIQTALSEQSDNAALLSIAARHYLSNKQPDKTVTILEPVVEKKPGTPLARLLIVAYGIQGNNEKSLAAARGLTKNSPNEPENWWILGRAALNSNKLGEAESALKTAIATKPGLVEAEIDLGNLYLVRKQSVDAERQFRAILQHQPDSLGAIKGLLVSLLQRETDDHESEEILISTADQYSAKTVMSAHYLRKGMLDDAERILSSIPLSEKNINTKRLHQRLALLRGAKALQSGDFDKARNVIMPGLELNPGDLELSLLLAQVELQSKNVGSAKKMVQNLIAQYPALPQPHELMGDIASHESDAAALQHYQTAWQAGAQDRTANKIYLNLRKNNPEAAIAFIDEWAKKLPNSASAYFFRGQNKQERGEIPAAIADYEAALELNPSDPRTLNNLAWLYSGNKDKRALEMAERAHKALPENPAVLDTYGWVLVQSGQTERGIIYLREAQKRAPESREIAEHLEQATKKSGQ